MVSPDRARGFGDAFQLRVRPAADGFDLAPSRRASRPWRPRATPCVMRVPAAMARRDILPATSSTVPAKPVRGNLLARFQAKLRGVERQRPGLRSCDRDHARCGDAYLDSRPDRKAVLAAIANVAVPVAARRRLPQAVQRKLQFAFGGRLPAEIEQSRCARAGSCCLHRGEQPVGGRAARPDA